MRIHIETEQQLRVVAMKAVMDIELKLVSRGGRVMDESHKALAHVIARQALRLVYPELGSESVVHFDPVDFEEYKRILKEVGIDSA
jgi:hypothetical protein